MVMSSTAIWGVLTAVFLVMEACTVALVAVWFAAGSLAALIAALAGAPFWAQTAAFVIVSGILLALLRPAMRKFTKITRTNIDAMIGTFGYVTGDIDNVAAKGEARFGSMTWTARSSSGEKIPAGTMVRADRIEGVRVYVTPGQPETTGQSK